MNQGSGALTQGANIPVAIVVARATNNVIGRNGALPWRLKADLVRFKTITMGKPLLMGRKTWDSLPRKPLPGRPNIVLSGDRTLLAPGAWVFPSFEAGLAAARSMAARDGAAEVCVIGGEAIFAAAMPLAARLYLTEVEANPAGDAVLPAIDESQWREISQELFPAGPDDEYPARLRVLERT